MYRGEQESHKSWTADQWSNYDKINEDNSNDDDYVNIHEYFAGRDFFETSDSNILDEDPVSLQTTSNNFPNNEYQEGFYETFFPSSYLSGRHVQDDCQQNLGKTDRSGLSRSTEHRIDNQERHDNEQSTKSENTTRMKKTQKTKSTPKERRRGNKSKTNKRTSRQKPNNYEDYYQWIGLQKHIGHSSLLAFGWLLLDLIKTASWFCFEKAVDIIPTGLSAGYAVVWYISVLLVLSTSLLCSLCYCLILNLPKSFWDKMKNMKDMRERLFKKKDAGEQCQQDERFQQNEHQQTAENSDELVSRLLDSRFKSAYDVLGLSESATDEEIKRKYRDVAKVVHPDKNTHPESGRAFQILQAAFEKINSEENRAEYQLVRDKEKIEDQFDDFLDLMKQRVNELKNRMFCSVCGETHPRLLTDRLVNAARYCGQCNIKHSAKDGDVWVETSHMGFKYYCYLCMDDQVFEVTEWASCQGLLRARANTHAVYISVKPNRPSHFPWDDLFGESDHSNQTNQNTKKKRNKSKTKSTAKKKK